MLTRRPPPAWMTRSGCRRPSSGADLVARQDDLLELDLADPGRHGDLVAQLAVDLDRDLAGLLGRGRLVDLRPALRVDR